MRIGIDARIGHRQGVGRVIAELIDGVSAFAPENEYVVFVKPGSSDALIQKLKGRGNVRWVPISGAPFRLREQLEMARAIRAERLELLHVTFDYGAPLSLPCKTVLTVHDAWFEPNDFFRSEWTRRYFQTMTRWGIKRSARVLTVSGFVKDKVLRYCPSVGRVDGKIRVVYNGVGEDFTPAGPRAPLRESHGLDRYLLYLGVLAKNKNIFGLLDSYAALLRRLPDAPALVLGGKRDQSLADPAAFAERLGIAERVRFLGYVPDEKLPELYRGASLFVFPSSHEGFGIPVVEAMASGTPVIASNTTAIPEVAGGAALLVDPSSPAAIANAMETVLRDAALRGDLIERGLIRARDFSWKKAAREVLSVYGELHEKN